MSLTYGYYRVYRMTIVAADLGWVNIDLENPPPVILG